MSAASDARAYERAMTFVNGRVETLHEMPGTVSVWGGAMVPYEPSTPVAFLAGVVAAEHVAAEIDSLSEAVAGAVEAAREAGHPVKPMVDGAMMVMALLGAQLGMRELAASQRAGGGVS